MAEPHGDGGDGTSKHVRSSDSRIAGMGGIQQQQQQQRTRGRDNGMGTEGIRASQTQNLHPHAVPGTYASGMGGRQHQTLSQASLNEQFDAVRNATSAQTIQEAYSNQRKAHIQERERINAVYRQEFAAAARAQAGGTWQQPGYAQAEHAYGPATVPRAAQAQGAGQTYTLPSSPRFNRLLAPPRRPTISPLFDPAVRYPSPAPPPPPPPTPPANAPPNGTFLWNLDGYVFFENMGNGITGKILYHGVFNGFHGMWMAPDGEEIARLRAWTEGYTPLMTFIPDGVGPERERTAMFGETYPRRFIPEGLREREVAERAGNGSGGEVVEKEQQAGETGASDRSKSAAMGGTGADLRPEVATRAERSSRSPKPIVLDDEIIDPETGAASRHPTHRNFTIENNPYDYRIDPTKVLITVLPADAVNALYTRFDYTPEEPLAEDMPGDELVQSEYADWPVSALCAKVKWSGETMGLARCGGGLLWADDQRVRGQVETLVGGGEGSGKGKGKERAA